MKRILTELLVSDTSICKLARSATAAAAALLVVREERAYVLALEDMQLLERQWMLWIVDVPDMLCATLRKKQAHDSSCSR